MIKTGVTGGIGSGKSVVCKVFETLGIPVYTADQRAKILMNEDPYIHQQLINYFGPEIYVSGVVNRPLLSKFIFNNKKDIAFVNNLVHPIVRTDFEKWCEQYNSHPYIIQEAALHFENESYKMMDVMITVTAPEAIRIERIQKRDSATTEQVLSRIRNQLPEADKIKKSDYIIINDNEHSLLEQILSIHQQIQLKH